MGSLTSSPSKKYTELKKNMLFFPTFAANTKLYKLCQENNILKS